MPKSCVPRRLQDPEGPFPALLQSILQTRRAEERALPHGIRDARDSWSLLQSRVEATEYLTVGGGGYAGWDVFHLDRTRMRTGFHEGARTCRTPPASERVRSRADVHAAWRDLACCRARAQARGLQISRGERWLSVSPAL